MNLSDRLQMLMSVELAMGGSDRRYQFVSSVLFLLGCFCLILVYQLLLYDVAQQQLLVFFFWHLFLI